MSISVERLAVVGILFLRVQNVIHVVVKGVLVRNSRQFGLLELGLGNWVLFLNVLSCELDGLLATSIASLVLVSLSDREKSWVDLGNESWI